MNFIVVIIIIAGFILIASRKWPEATSAVGAALLAGGWAFWDKLSGLW